MHNEFNRETCIRTRSVCHYVTHRLRSADNAYPFLSGAGRQTLGIPKDAHKFPGPGSYNIEAPRKRIPERAFSLFMPHLFAILPHRHTRGYSISSEIQLFTGRR